MTDEEYEIRKQNAYKKIKIVLNGRVKASDMSKRDDLSISAYERRVKDVCKKNTAAIRSIYDIEDKIIPEKSESNSGVDEKKRNQWRINIRDYQYSG